MIHSPAGVLNIDKPQGLTSHDVVARVRRHIGMRRVGHAGTLDPLATGILLVCVGAATRISDYLQAGRKVYETTIRLGEHTDTYDAEGQILATAPVPELEQNDLARTLARFTGDILQMPPMYSAIKHKGKPLHRLARAGVEVERKPRPVTIDAIAITAWQSPDLTIRVTCSPGTYIRSLAHDVGEALGCGGHVRILRRLGSGTWRVEDALTLDEFLAAGDDWARFLHGLRASLSMLPAIILAAEPAYRFALGQRIALPEIETGGGEYKVLGPDEHLLGIGRIEAGDPVLRPAKVFADPTALTSDL